MPVGLLSRSESPPSEWDKLLAGGFALSPLCSEVVPLPAAPLGVGQIQQQFREAGLQNNAS